jgi:uncharacterized OB-fold protein
LEPAVLYSHTTIRVAGVAHAAEAPFVVVLVDTPRGRVLGRLRGDEVPPIGTPLVDTGERDGVPMFEAAR